MHALARSNQRSKHITPNRQRFLRQMKKESAIVNQPLAARVSRTGSLGPVPRHAMHQRIALGVAGIALVAACTTPIASADYPTDNKKYDACVANEKAQYPVPPGMAYWLEREIRSNCGEPPPRPKDEKK